MRVGNEFGEVRRKSDHTDTQRGLNCTRNGMVSFMFIKEPSRSYVRYGFREE